MHKSYRSTTSMRREGDRIEPLIQTIVQNVSNLYNLKKSESQFIDFGRARKKRIEEEGRIIQIDNSKR